MATYTARRFPSAAGLIGVMPLTGALVLAWVYLENQGDPNIMVGFASGSLRPLYVTASGIDETKAAERIRRRPGAHRLPTLLKRVDLLAREQGKEHMPQKSRLSIAQAST